MKVDSRRFFSFLGLKSSYSRKLSAGLAAAAILTVVSSSGCAGLTTQTSQGASSDVLSVNPTNLAFGNVQVGTIGTQTLTLTNPGKTSLTVSQAQVSGTGFAASTPALPMTLSAGQSAKLNIQFTPTVPNSATGSVTILSTASNSPARIALSGTGTQPQPQLSAKPVAVSFGNVAVGGSNLQTIQLTNLGTATTIISQATFSGLGFAMIGLTPPLTIAPGMTATFSASFAPTVAGSATGSISLVSNAVGSPLSISLSGTAVSAVIAPGISSQPVNQTVTAGQTAAFSVVATGSSPLSYQWRKNGTAINGATSASYTTPTTTSADTGSTFNVLVSNSAGGVTSNAATLTVNAATVAPAINTQPLNQTVTAGQTASFSVGATGSAPLSYQWQKNSAAISGANSSSYTTPATTSSDNGAQFTVAVSNSAGSVTSSPATLTVNSASASFPVWVQSSLLRVGQTDAPGASSSISLSGARGETADSQVIVQGPAGGLTNVNVSASPLAGPNGATIPASNVTLYREYYLSVTGTASYGGGSNPPLGSGTYAEPLIPFNDPETGAALCGSSASLKACNASVSAGQNQPYWIDISIPHGVANSPAGTYTGSITISSSQGTATIPVSLTVWNFELPMQPSELSLWTLWPPASGNTTATLASALMRNKVMSWYDVAGNASSDVTNMGLNRSGLDNYYYIGIQCNGGYSSIPSTSQINAAAANFPAGLGLDFYMADELNGCTGDYSDIKTLGANAHAANRSVKTMMTLNATDPNLYGSVDHWVLLDSMQQWPALPFTAGGDLWSYTSCNAGYGNTPEWMVDYPPINERIQAGFLNFAQGATGLLYYRADGWTAGNAIGSWNNVDTTACGGGLGRPGDGIFLYPPAPIASTESAPGIRLKAIRDGIQDYEYAQMLKNLGQLSVVDSTLLPIATSWSNWSHDPNALQNARTALGQLLHQLAP